ncbi:MAG: tetratricopeptide repeat protein [Campylobacterota bacterium]|nr:tetratricopeptide repeat protein [Campylobacterota bacterium]
MQFLYPNVFFVMLIPLILLIVLILTSKDTMQKHFSKSILDKLSVGGKSLNKTTRNGLLFITLLLFIVALSRPVINQKEQDIKQSLIPIVIALDVSKSMMANDIYPNRIELAKKKLKEIINISKNSTIGVLLFAKNSFILSPVTEDFISLNYIVDNLDTNLEFSNGSNIFAVLEATSHMLSDFKVKNLIILSDGGNDNGYEDEIEFALENKIAIYSVGIATSQGAAIPQKDGYLTDSKGNIVNVKLNESIKNLSLKTQGGYIDYTLDTSDIDAIITQINSQSKKEELTTKKIKTYTELFYYPLALAIFVLFLALSSLPKIRIKSKSVNSLIIVAVATVGFIPSKSTASFFEFENIKNATKYYENNEFKEASDEYRKLSTTPQSLYNLANSLYKEEKYKEAIDTYSKIVTTNKELEAKKLHNIGNSYVKSNNLEKAKEFYEKSLKIKDDKQTKENLDIVNKELEKQKKQEDKKKNDKENQKQKDDKKKENQEQEKNKKNKQKDKNSDDKKKKDEKSKNKNKDGNQKNDKKDKNSNNTQKDKQNEQIKKESISDMEEKKWMQKLNKQKTPVYLQKVKTKNESNIDENQPW